MAPILCAPLVLHLYGISCAPPLSTSALCPEVPPTSLLRGYWPLSFLFHLQQQHLFTVYKYSTTHLGIRDSQTSWATWGIQGQPGLHKTMPQKQANKDPKMCRIFSLKPHERIMQVWHSTMIRLRNRFLKAEWHEPPRLPTHTIHRALV